MRRKYSPLTNALAKWLFPLIDRYDCGFYDYKDKCPKSYLTNEAMNTMLAFGAGWGIKPITRTQLEEHLFDGKTKYFRSSYKSRYAFINLDIDAHNGEIDAEEAAAFICDNFHNGVYYEPSTNGSGRHIYLLIDRNFMKLRRFKALLKEYVDALKYLMKEEKLDAVVDRACGTHSITTATTTNIGTKRRVIEKGDRGILGKIPRLPHRDQSLRQLIAAPVQPVTSLYNVIIKAENLKEQKISSKKQATNNKQAKHTEILTSPDSPRSLQEVKEETNAFKRMQWACSQFRRTHRDFPTVDQLLKFYEGHNLNTGCDQKNRRRLRATKIIEYQKTHRTNSWAGAFSPKLYQQLIESVVKTEHYAGVKVDRNVSTEDLAIGLYTLEMNAVNLTESRRWQYTCGNKAIKEMFAALTLEGVTSRGCNTNKAVAIKNILCNAGLIVCLDSTWYYGGPVHGRCKKFGLGPNHPRLTEHLDIQRIYEQEEDHTVGYEVKPERALEIDFDYLFDDAPSVDIDAGQTAEEAEFLRYEQLDIQLPQEISVYQRSVGTAVHGQDTGCHKHSRDSSRSASADAGRATDPYHAIDPKGSEPVAFRLTSSRDQSDSFEVTAGQCGGSESPPRASRVLSRSSETGESRSERGQPEVQSKNTAGP